MPATTFREAWAKAKEEAKIKRKRPRQVTKVMIIHESKFGSLVKDISSLGVLMVAAWANHVYCGGSGWLNFLFVALFVMLSMRIKADRDIAVYTPSEAWDWMHRNVPRS